ncbi:MAG: hypothetical protein HWN66_04445 [Candidatus Helarchaeota archaeon]|nr:hypothetical protein [Candidatus Helarchaeota archaeon]
MFESIIALPSSNTRRMKSAKFLKTFASFNWSSVQVEINCRPRKKHNGPFTTKYNAFNIPPNKMVRCKKTPLESIQLEGTIGNSKLKITCIFSEGTSRWVEAKIEGENKSMITVIEKQLLKIFRLK